MRIWSTLYKHKKTRWLGRVTGAVTAAGLPEALVETTAFLPGNQSLPLLRTTGGDAVSTSYDRRLRKIGERRSTHGGTALATAFAYDEADRLVGERDA